jgi:hypothetical protein
MKSHHLAEESAIGLGFFAIEKDVGAGIFGKILPSIR